MTTSSEVLAMLRGHFGGAPSKPEPGYFVTEIQAPNSPRRADALWVPLGSQARGELWGFEVKVSRGDLIAELVDPTKADAWLRYCDYWYVVVADERIVDGLDIPEHWGILAPPSGRSKRLMTVVRKAPMLKPASKDPAFSTIMARLYFGDSTTENEIRDLRSRLDIALESSKRSAKHAQDLAQQLADVGSLTEDHHRAADLITKIRARGNFWPDLDLIAEAVSDVAAVRSQGRALVQEVTTTKRQLESIVRRSVEGDLLPKITALAERLGVQGDDL